MKVGAYFRVLHKITIFVRGSTIKLAFRWQHKILFYNFYTVFMLDAAFYDTLAYRPF